jgi:hypothetical protein
MAVQQAKTGPPGWESIPELLKRFTNTGSGIFKLLKNPGIDSASLCSLPGRYDNSIPIAFPAAIDCSKILALK